VSPPSSCFDLDLATGKYTPSAPSPTEALGVSDDPGPTVEHEDNVARVCHRGTCRDVKLRALENATRTEVIVDDDAKLLAAAYHIVEGERSAVLVYDVATGKRVSQFIALGSNNELVFLDQTLLVTSTPCAGPCSSTNMFDARKGKLLAGVGVNTSAMSPTKLAGDIYAFNDWDSRTVVLQSIKTGRIKGSLELPKHACTNEPDSEYVSCEGITLLTSGSNIVVLPSVRPGDVMIVDQKGKLVADHRLPLCQ
jgi:hypothetical protein